MKITTSQFKNIIKKITLHEMKKRVFLQENLEELQPLVSKIQNNFSSLMDKAGKPVPFKALVKAFKVEPGQEEIFKHLITDPENTGGVEYHVDVDPMRGELVEPASDKDMDQLVHGSEGDELSFDPDTKSGGPEGSSVHPDWEEATDDIDPDTIGAKKVKHQRREPREPKAPPSAAEMSWDDEHPENTGGTHRYTEGKKTPMRITLKEFKSIIRKAIMLELQNIAETMAPPAPTPAQVAQSRQKPGMAQGQQKQQDSGDNLGDFFAQHYAPGSGANLKPLAKWDTYQGGGEQPALLPKKPPTGAPPPRLQDPGPSLKNIQTQHNKDRDMAAMAKMRESRKRKGK